MRASRGTSCAPLAPIWAAAAVALGALHGCAAPDPAPAHTTKPALLAPSAALPMRGEYVATFKVPLLGEIRGRFDAEPTPDGFVATTRPGIAWDMVGGLEGLLGPIFVRSLFPDGSILVWRSALPADGHPADGTLGPGLRSAQVRTRMTAPDKPIDIYTSDGKHVATMSIRPASTDEPPPADYRALAAAVRHAISEQLYDSSLLDSGQVHSYLRQLAENAARAQDDIEFVFGATVAARNHLNFSFPLVFKSVDSDWRTQLPALRQAGLSAMRVSFDPRSGIATLKADALLDAADVDRAMAEVLDHNPSSLLLDLRGCPGVSLASLRVLSWLIDGPVDSGTVFGPRLRRAGTPQDFAQLPVLEISSAESVEAIEAQLDNAGPRAGARLTVLPAPRHFTGPVAVLTATRTGTSAELLCWALKLSGRARLFGQATAGRPTLSRPIDIGQGWVVWLPTLDYRPPTGELPSDRACHPETESGSKDRVYRTARQWLESQRQQQD